MATSKQPTSCATIKRPPRPAHTHYLREYYRPSGTGRHSGGVSLLARQNRRQPSRTLARISPEPTTAKPPLPNTTCGIPADSYWQTDRHGLERGYPPPASHRHQLGGPPESRNRPEVIDTLRHCSTAALWQNHPNHDVDCPERRSSRIDRPSE